MRNLIVLLIGVGVLFFNLSAYADIHADIDSCSVTTNESCLRDILHRLASQGGGGTGDIACIRDGDSWHVVRVSDKKKLGYWNTQDQCENSISSARQGAVCGLYGSEVLIYSIQLGKFIANGGPSYEQCWVLTQAATNGTICGRYGGGMVRFKISTGEILGDC